MAMTKQTYVELYNLIDDEMRRCGEECERQCDTIAQDLVEIEDPAAKRAFDRIKKYRKRFHEMQDLLARFEEEVEEPEEKKN